MPDPDPSCDCAQAGDRWAAVAGRRWGGESLVELWFQAAEEQAAEN